MLLFRLDVDTASVSQSCSQRANASTLCRQASTSVRDLTASPFGPFGPFWSLLVSQKRQRARVRAEGGGAAAAAGPRPVEQQQPRQQYGEVQLREIEWLEEKVRTARP